jgi:hypothetical protein
MDLSFLRNGKLTPADATPVERMRVAVWPFLLTAPAAQQAASPTAQAMADILRGQEADEKDDWVQALADIFAPRDHGVIEAEGHEGSFNPLVASRLRVGQRR